MRKSCATIATTFTALRLLISKFYKITFSLQISCTFQISNKKFENGLGYMNDLNKMRSFSTISTPLTLQNTSKLLYKLPFVEKYVQ